MDASPAGSDQILERAAARRAAKGLSYAGEVTPAEAWALHHECGARIVDVRSRFEHQYIGRVPGSALIEWRFWPGSVPNPDFLTELQQQCEPDDIVLLLCRSAARSHSAAMAAAEAGFTQVFNILEGFEG